VYIHETRLKVQITDINFSKTFGKVPRVEDTILFTNHNTKRLPFTLFCSSGPRLVIVYESFFLVVWFTRATNRIIWKKYISQKIVFVFEQRIRLYGNMFYIAVWKWKKNKCGFININTPFWYYYFDLHNDIIMTRSE